MSRDKVLLKQLLSPFHQGLALFGQMIMLGSKENS
jgi:hypothetical protein